MGAMIALGVAGLAASVGGSVMGAMGQASNAKAQAMQAEVNRQWQEFEKQSNLIAQRGKMGIAEMDRLYRNEKLMGESFENLLAQNRAAREQFEYSTNQYSRNFRQNEAAFQVSAGSRGAGRGGTADAIKNMSRENSASDQLRIKANFENQLDMFENQRNQQLGQLNARSADKPPMYIPSAPIPMPNTDGMVLGAALSGLGAGLGGVAGMMSGMQGTQNTPQAYNTYLSATGGVSPSQIAALNLAG